jgi:hypothetical protein
MYEAEECSCKQQHSLVQGGGCAGEGIDGQWSESKVYLCCDCLQVTSPPAVSHLLQMLGSQQAGSSNSSSFPGAATCSTDGTAALVPADTLQLVLDFLQQRLPTGHMSSRSSCAGQHARQFTDPCSSAYDATGASKHGAGSSGTTAAAAASGRSGAARNAEGEAADGHIVKAHCWQLLTAVMKLTSKWHACRSGGHALAIRQVAVHWFNSCPWQSCGTVAFAGTHCS